MSMDAGKCLSLFIKNNTSLFIEENSDKHCSLFAFLEVIK